MEVSSIQRCPDIGVLIERSSTVFFTGDHSKISLKTKNVFIECTATDLKKVCTYAKFLHGGAIYVCAGKNCTGYLGNDFQ